jgi:hypothetical protein
MEERHRSRIGIGVVLIVLGAWFLAVQLVPGLGAWASINLSWPLIIVAVGLTLLLIGLLGSTPGMAIPASIVTGVGALLYWQNATGNWESWAYAWTLFPGFVGLGTILAGLLGDRGSSVSGGAWLVLISAVMFAAFGSFLGGPQVFGTYWPLLLIGLGVLLLIRPLTRRRT